MKTITISRIDGPPATFGSSKILRVTRGIISPIPGQRTPKSEVTIDDSEPIIHTDEDMQHILAKVGNSVPMVRLTAPDGSPTLVNAKRVADIQKPDPDDIKDISEAAEEFIAHARFYVDKYRNFVRETVEEVKHAIGKAIAKPL